MFAMLRQVAANRAALRAVWPQYRRAFSRLATAHSSWFRIPDQGMEKHELLARGSGFFVRGPTSGVLMALVSAHVAAPHRFKKYFPQDWLGFVRDEHCRTLLETRSADGVAVTGRVISQELQSGYRHSGLDVAAFVLGDAGDAGVTVLELDERGLDDGSAGTAVVISGHRLVGQSGSGNEAVVPTEVTGAVSEVDRSRGFVNTGAVDTEMGMCGGPVVRAAERGVCMGLLEGLVPRVGEGESAESEVHERIGGHSLFITARELRMFVADVETDYEKRRQKPESSGV